MSKERTLLFIAILACLYVIFAKVGLTLAVTHKSVTLIWPPTGLAIAALLIYGRNLWPGILIGAFATNLMLGSSSHVAFSIAIGNSLEAMLAYLWLHKVGFSKNFSSIKQVCQYLIFAVMISTIISSVVGTFSLWNLAGLPSEKAFKVFIDWWLGDALGAMVIGPLLLVCHEKSPLSLFKDKTFLGLNVSLVVVSWLSFSGFFSSHLTIYLLLFFPIPILIALSFLYEERGAVLGLIIVTVSSVLSIFFATGELNGDATHFKLVFLFSFLTSSGVIAFLCAAGVHQHKEHDLVVSSIVESTAVYTGEDFLKNLVKNLSQVLNTKYAFVGEINKDFRSAKTISVYGGGEYIDNFDYLLEGTPCYDVVQVQFCSHPRNVQNLYPDDKLLVDMGAESYIGSLLFNSKGIPIGILAVLDIDEILDENTAKTILQIFAGRAGAELERKNTDALLIESKNEAESSNKAKGEFLAVMSHELRTPLNVILGMNASLLELVDEEEKVKMLKIQERAAHGLMDLLTDVLDVSKIERGVLLIENDDFDSKTFFESVIDILDPSGERAQLFFNYTDELPRNLISDSKKLRQVLINLIGNALKFTPDGRVDVNVHFEKLNDTSGHLKVAVIDNGIGIPEERIEEILKPFTQVDSSHSRTYGGTGLGLSIVKSLIELLKGELEVESEVGKGSCFRFAIKVGFHERDLKKKVIQASDHLVSQVPHLKILLAEDSEDNIELMKIYLKNLDCELDIVVNGQEAIEKFKLKKYDLILMDVQMPVLDGISATQSIRFIENEESKEKVVIFALTANAMESDIRKSMEVGFDKHIAKPVQKKDFLNIIVGSFLK